MLSHQPDFEVVGVAASFEEASQLTQKLSPDLILMDIELTDSNGFESLKTLLEQSPDSKVVMLAVQETDELLFTAIRNGAEGYLLKDISAANLFVSIRALKRDEMALSRTMTTRIVKEFSRLGSNHNSADRSLDKLTTREVEILKFLGLGLSNREIAERLIISENTVKIHVHNILDKLKLRNRREAGRIAFQQGLVNTRNRLPGANR